MTARGEKFDLRSMGQRSGGCLPVWPTRFVSANDDLLEQPLVAAEPPPPLFGFSSRPQGLGDGAQVDAAQGIGVVVQGGQEARRRAAELLRLSKHLKSLSLDWAHVRG